MIRYSSLTLEELIQYGTDGDADAALVIVRRLPELYTLKELEDACEEAEEEARKNTEAEAIEFLEGLIDGEHWSAKLDEETREWLKKDLEMFGK